MSDPRQDQIAELADQVNEANRQAGNDERIDIVFTTEHIMKVSEDRKKFYDALDKMLDMVDANGFSQDDIFIKVKTYDVEGKPEVESTIENLMEFVTEFASGEIEEVTVESWTIKDGKQTSNWKQTIE